MSLKVVQPYAYKGQTLIDHITGCLNKLESFLYANPNYTWIAYARLSSAGVDVVEPEAIKDALRLGVLVHDLGKVYRYYQENIEKYGFEGHEILSAVSCYKILKDYRILKDQRQLKVLLLIAVLNHHQAFRESIPELLWSETGFLIKKVKHIAKSGLCGSVANLEPILKRFGLTVEETFTKDYSEFESIFNKIKELLVRFLCKNFDENRRWLKLHALLTFPIVLADDLDAYEKRGNKSAGDRLIIKELRRAIENE